MNNINNDEPRVSFTKSWNKITIAMAVLLILMGIILIINSTSKTNINTNTIEYLTIEDVPPTDIPDVTMGMILYDKFKTIVEENPDKEILDIGNEIMADEMFGDDGYCIPVTGYSFIGMSNEVKGYKEAMKLYMKQEDIPFIGYIFTLNEGANKEFFLQILNESFDSTWNRTAIANETYIEIVEDKILFLMCPFSLEWLEEHR